MNRFHFLGLLLLGGVMSRACCNAAVAAENALPQCYELRIYSAADGKLDALNTRFREHTTQLFVRHGMTNVGYWLPIDNPQRRLVYLLAYPDRAARETSWKAFNADPEWISVRNASESTGKIVSKVESRFLTPTDFSPEMKVMPGEGVHTFEIRTYTTTPGNLPRLLDRFRRHTLELFSKHGMQHFCYFTLMPGQPASDETLIYFLVHATPASRDVSFAAFGADPEWIQVKSESEVAAGGPLTVPDGVKSELLKATDYSPVK